MVDFKGGALPTLPPDAKPKPVVDASLGTVARIHTEKTPFTDRWRVTLTSMPGGRSGGAADVLQPRQEADQRDLALPVPRAQRRCLRGRRAALRPRAQPLTLPIVRPVLMWLRKK